MYLRLACIFMFTAVNFFIAAFMGAAVLDASTVSCVSGKCHREISVKRYLHGPIATGSCEVCHQISRWPMGKHPSLLTHNGAEKCFFCHEEARDMAEHKFKHTPVEKGECTACHEPHQSDNRFLLSAGTGDQVSRSSDLCFSCHDSEGAEWENGFHASVALLDCNICHDPHSSAYRFHLTRYVRTVYLRDHLALGEQELEAGNYAEALENLGNVLTVEPREVSALIMASKAHLAEGRPESAAPFVDTLLEINPLNPEALYLEALIEEASGQDYRAMSLLQQSVSIRNGVPEVLLELGLVQFRNGMGTEALSSLTKAAAESPDDPRIHEAMAEVFDSLGRTGDADKERAIVRELSGATASP